MISRAAADATANASSGVRSSLASPRTPSVPNMVPPADTCRGSALRVLRRLAGLLQPVLLALLHPRVAGQKACLLQRRTVLGVQVDQSTGDGQPQRTGLTGDPPTAQRRDDVVLPVPLKCDER